MHKAEKKIFFISNFLVKFVFLVMFSCCLESESYFSLTFLNFSALDTASEYQVKEALDRVMKGRSVITIAHRISTIENAGMFSNFPVSPYLK